MATKKPKANSRKRTRKPASDCTLPPTINSKTLAQLKLNPEPEHERRAIQLYMEAEAHDEEVVHLEKVASERVFGAKHDVWDVHTDKQRWWVITGPTNLYRQSDFPSLDYVLSLHVGLMARVMSRRQKESPAGGGEHGRLLAAWRRWEQAAEALDTCEEAEDFQAVGMRCRECLLELVQAASYPSMLRDGEDAPKRGDFIHWSEIIARAISPGSSGDEVRSFLKSAAKAAWQLTNWLTHAKNACRADGQLALDATSSTLSAFATRLLTHEHGVPPRCPRCSSYQISTDYRLDGPADDPARSFLVCSRCGWDAPVSEGANGCGPSSPGRRADRLS